MKLRSFVSAILLLSGLAACGGVSAHHGGPGRDGGPDSAGPLAPDEDGDGISDDYEGRSTMVDTDGDGTPDYMDADSDGDTVPDSLEGGVTSGMAPVDSDGDGTADFRDLESDGNGIPDMVEGGGDIDGDHQPDSRDHDNDGDGNTDVMEIGADPTAPTDFDGDATPDYDDTDSDNDTISDFDEGPTGADTDMDMTLDYHDTDSDNDGYTDSEEAGDADIGTSPRDTDMDLTPDFRDPDSDNDGLSDATEHTGGTNPLDADTDHDGVTDLVELGACPAGDPTCAMDATDPASSPRTRGDFVFFEPYMMPPDPTMDTLIFSTSIRTADVYFLMDTTGSMGASITSLSSGIGTPTTGLIDRVRTVIPDVWFGVGDFKDYGDVYLYRNGQDITSDPALARAAASALSPSGGGDGPEADVPSLYAVASGGAVSSSPSIAARTGCGAGTFGWPCFRSSAVPIVVLITDWSFHNDRTGADPYSGYTNYATMLGAVTTNRIKVVGIAQQTGGDWGALADLNDIARDSGAIDGTGAPLTSVYSGGSISDVVVSQISELASATLFDISIQYQDDPSDAVDSYAAFVDHIAANTAGDAARGCGPHAATDTDGDGYPDTFTAVTAGTPVCFDIFVKQNDTVMPTPMPQIFRATLNVVGNGFTVVDSRDVFFLVPPHIEVPMHPFG